MVGSKTKYLFTLIIFFTSVCIVNGQTTTKEISNHFFQIYSKDPMAAIDYAFSTNKWFDRKLDAQTTLKNKLKTLIDVCGDYNGYEKLTEKKAGTSSIITSFIMKYNREPVRLVIFFYKPKDIWQVNNIAFDEDIDEDLKEAAKAYRLKENY